MVNEKNKVESLVERAAERLLADKKLQRKMLDAMERIAQHEIIRHIMGDECESLKAEIAALKDKKKQLQDEVAAVEKELPVLRRKLEDAERRAVVAELRA